MTGTMTGSDEVEVRAVPTRRVSFEESLRTLTKHYAADEDLILSHMFAALSAVFPDGEDFFVRSVRHFRDQITDPVLQRQVAGFIGGPAMNLLPGRATRTGERDDAVLIGIRPEHIALCEPGRGLSAKVETIEYLGAESMLICRHDETHRVTVRMRGRVSAGIGEHVGLVWPADAEHRFVREHGRRVARD